MLRPTRTYVLPTNRPELSALHGTGDDLDVVAKEEEQQVLVSFAEGGEATLVGLEHGGGQHQGLHRLPQPALYLLLGWQVLRHLQQHPQLAVVTAQPPYLIPPLPGICTTLAASPLPIRAIFIY